MPNVLADLSPVPALRKAAQQISQLSSERRVARLVRECHRLLSVRAEANSPVIAQAIIREIETLADGEYDALFEALAHEFSPEPAAVLNAAQAYAAGPSAATLATRCASVPSWTWATSRLDGGVRLLSESRAATTLCQTM